MTTIGQTLAAAREGAGLSLADLSARTCIRRPVLAGIEADDFRACGGDFYARGHIRAVCRELDVDPSGLIDRFDSEHAHERTVPAFTGKAVTAGMHSSGRQERAAEDRGGRGHDGGQESGARGGAGQEAGHELPAPRSPETGAPAYPAHEDRSGYGASADARPHPGGPVPEARRADSAAADTPVEPRGRHGRHGRPGPQEQRGDRPDGRGAERGDREHAEGAGAQPAAGSVPPRRRQRKDRKPSLLAATIAAARRSWPLVVVLVLAGAAVAAAVASWPDGRSEQSAGVGRLFQREAPADAAPAPGQEGDRKGREREQAQDQGQRPEQAQGQEQQARPAPRPSFGAGLSGVTAGEAKAPEVHLTVSATERVWVEITDAEGDNRFSGVLDKGDVRAWEHADELRLHVGDASAVRVTVNGDHRGTLSDTARVAQFTYSAADLA